MLFYKNDIAPITKWSIDNTPGDGAYEAFLTAQQNIDLSNFITYFSPSDMSLTQVLQIDIKTLRLNMDQSYDFIVCANLSNHHKIQISIKGYDEQNNRYTKFIKVQEMKAFRIYYP